MESHEGPGQQVVTRDRSRSMARTRGAIVDAAIVLLGRQPGASMAEIAQAAGTARSTVHRYFPERVHLVEALRARAEQEVVAATARALEDGGTGRDALLRVCEEYFQLGDLLTVAFADFTRADDLAAAEEPDSAVASVIGRGQVDGSIDPTLPVRWVEQLLWSLLDAAWTDVQLRRATTRQALDLSLRSLTKLVRP